MAQTWRIGSSDYDEAIRQEGDYWGEEIEKALQQGIPFSADMRRAERLFVDRGPGLPQQQVYDPVAERIMNGELYQLLFDRVAAISNRCRVLVLTCGPGGLALELARQGHRVQAMDISDRAIAVAERMARENPFQENFGDLQYTVADLNRVELPPNAYEAVVAWDGLHHIVSLDRLLQQVRNSLAPKGIFIFSDNVGMSLLSRLFGGVLYFLLPTHVPYRTKLTYALGGQRKIKEEMTQRSPFEEVSSGQIMQTVERHFTIIQAKAHTGIGFRAAIAGDFKGPDRLKHPFLWRLKKLDDWFVQHRLLPADHVLAVAVAKSL